MMTTGSSFEGSWELEKNYACPIFLRNSRQVMVNVVQYTLQIFVGQIKFEQTSTSRAQL